MLFATNATAMDGTELKQLADAYMRIEQGTATELIDASDAGKFIGYIGGVVEAYPFIKLCQPQRVTMGQQFAIVTKYLNDNPEKWNQRASHIIIEAMYQAFPCSK